MIEMHLFYQKVLKQINFIAYSPCGLWFLASSFWEGARSYVLP